MKPCLENMSIYLLLIVFGFKSTVAGPSNPNLEVHPMPDTGTLIYYNAKDEASVLKWTKAIDDFLAPYRSNVGMENRVVCSPTSVLYDKQVCDVAINDFHPCTSANQYNYGKTGPCIFLRLNKIFNWTADTYNTADNLPEKMPEDLKQHIAAVSGRPEANKIWVSCEGENPADVEYRGPVMYFPSRGFPSYYFPFKNQEGYLDPLVAVLFEKPSTGILINIECKAWAKNIVNDRYERGSVHFELMVDN